MSLFVSFLGVTFRQVCVINAGKWELCTEKLESYMGGGAVRCGPLCLLVNKIKFRILKREVAGGADREARVTTDRQHCRSELNGPVGDTSAETRWGPLVGWGG